MLSRFQRARRPSFQHLWSLLDSVSTDHLPKSVNTVELGLGSFAPGSWSSQDHTRSVCTLRNVGRSFSTPSGIPTGDQPEQSSASTATLQARLNQAGWTRQEVLNVPNLISMARLLSGPAIAALILHEVWAVATISLALSGASDWLDGYVARKWNQGSRLGSYLDPLADKVLICSTVAALGVQGSLPMPMVVLIIGRDALLVSGALLHRAHQIGRSHLNFREFFRLGSAQAPNLAAGQSASQSNQAPIQSDISRASQPQQVSAPEAAFVQPLWISKINTAFQLGLIGACLTNSWYAWPGVEGIWLLSGLTGCTTALSGIAYVRQYH